MKAFIGAILGQSLGAWCKPLWVYKKIYSILTIFIIF